MFSFFPNIAPEVVAAIISASVVLAGIVIGAVSSRRLNNAVKLRSSLIRAYQQIKAFHLLEAELLKALAEATNGSEYTLKRQYRARLVEQNDCVKPRLTADAAQKRIESLEDTAWTPSFLRRVIQ